jgi:peptidoglycan/xylan/chitin deacetylase (PgdA/CDA1 family)
VLTVASPRPVPVLIYHHVSPRPGDTVTVTPDVFASQVHWLVRSGYRFLTADQVVAHVTGVQPVTEPAVALTVDDGWLDFQRHAWPLLAELGLPVTLFIVTGRAAAAGRGEGGEQALLPGHEESKQLIAAGRADRVVMGWDLLRELTATGLVSCHSHLESHRRAAELADADLAGELARSRQTLERELGMGCPFLCWPYGSWDERTADLALAAGYRALFTTVPRPAAWGGGSRAIPRIEAQDSLPWLQQLMASCGADFR